MNWKNLYIAGLLLSLSPFNIVVKNYTFPYSIFGYGMILLSFLYQKVSKKEAALIINLIFIILSVFFNSFFLLAILQALFFLGTAVIYFIESSNTIVFVISFFVVGASGFIIPVLIAASMGLTTLKVITDILNISYYIFFITLTALFVLSYKETL